MKIKNSHLTEKNGKIIILAAPSGSGKTTLARRLLRDFSHLKFSVSATTRSPRNNEKHGEDYYFYTPREFDRAIKNHEFLEWEEFFGGERYGTLTSDVENKLKKGYYILFDVEVKGALKIKKIYGKDALAIFVKPPSDKVLLERLKNRGTENEKTLQLRLERVRMELDYADRFDHTIVNDELERAYNELKELTASFLNETTTT